jgi:membrane-associated PAP2 superfamily phosphatase
MNVKTLWIVLLIAAIVGLQYGLQPEWDIAFSQMFFEKGRFIASDDHVYVLIRTFSMWVPRAVVAFAVFSVLKKFFFPRSLMPMRGRSAVFLIVTIIAGPLLLVNVGFKDHYGRPRPVQVTEFGGKDAFVPWWEPGGACPRNCSFVSGEGSGAFWMIAPAALVPAPWTGIAYAGAIAFGVGISLLRVAFGGHFFTDVFFAAVFTYLVIWISYAAFFRWPSTRPRPGVIEEAIGRAGERFRARIGLPVARGLAEQRRR